MLIRSGDGEVRNVSVPMWLVQLLTRPALKGNLRLGPEDLISISFADKLRVWSLEGRLKGCWTHLPHELGGKGSTAKVRVAVAKALGLIPGSADFVFTWNGGSGWIELKAPNGGLTLTQRFYRDWCGREGVPWACCRSSQAAEDVLRSWGILN